MKTIRHMPSLFSPRPGAPVFLLIAAVFTSLAAKGADEPRKAAIFVSNRSGPELDEKVMVLEDLISSRISNYGFRIYSREAVIDSAHAFRGDSGAPESELDRLLSENTSALRLAQNMGADYLITASIISCDRTKKVNKAYVETEILEHTLRVTYKIIEAATGGSVAGDTFTEKTKTRYDATSAEFDGDAVNQLLDQAAERVAASMRQKASEDKIPDTPAKARRVSLSVSCGMADLNIPGIVKNKDGTCQITANNYTIEPMNVTVELNGTVVGTAPGTFKVRPGLSKIRLTREGFKPWERTINVYDGQELRVSLSLSDAGYARWKDATAFLQGLKKDAQLTEAQVEQIQGIAEMFRNSYFRIKDLEIEHKTQSLFQ